MCCIFYDMLRHTKYISRFLALKHKKQVIMLQKFSNFSSLELFQSFSLINILTLNTFLQPWTKTPKFSRRSFMLQHHVTSLFRQDFHLRIRSSSKSGKLNEHFGNFFSLKHCVRWSCLNPCNRPRAHTNLIVSLLMHSHWVSNPILNTPL